MRARRLFACLFLSAAGLVGCGDSAGTPTGPSDAAPDADQQTPDEWESIRQQAVEIINADPRLAATTPLARDDYQALADEIAKIPGVAGAAYAGDDRGSIVVKLEGAGSFNWRHINDPRAEAMSIPEDFDYALFNDPVDNPDFEAPEVQSSPRSSGTYADSYPVATIDPDPQFTADDAVSCPEEGSIAIVDFYYTEVKAKGLLYNNEYEIDGMEIWQRLAKMGEAAGFKVDFFKDDEINASNFASKLKGYTYVVTNGHGGPPGPVNTDRLGEALVTFDTPEQYDAAKTLEDGSSYELAWKAGWINRGLTDNTVRWTPRLIEGIYAPSVPQMWLLNQCNAMMPSSFGWVKGADGYEFRQVAAAPLFNFGRALRAKGVNAAFGYVLGANVWAVAHNTMKFFRRQFAGNFNKDHPPSQNFWPLCMSAQTYFRLSSTPHLPIYANKVEGTSIYTMYGQQDPLFLRKICQGSPANVHAMMVDFVFTAGTPATAFGNCWDQWWSKGDAPSGIQDALCSKGDFPTTQEDTTRAACGVKLGRKVTLAMLP